MSRIFCCGVEISHVYEEANEEEGGGAGENQGMDIYKKLLLVGNGANIIFRVLGIVWYAEALSNPVLESQVAGPARVCSSTSIISNHCHHQITNSPVVLLPCNSARL